MGVSSGLVALLLICVGRLQATSKGISNNVNKVFGANLLVILPIDQPWYFGENQIVGDWKNRKPIRFYHQDKKMGKFLIPDSKL